MHFVFTAVLDLEVTHVICFSSNATNPHFTILHQLDIHNLLMGKHQIKYYDLWHDFRKLVIQCVNS